MCGNSFFEPDKDGVAAHISVAPNVGSKGLVLGRGIDSDTPRRSASFKRRSDFGGEEGARNRPNMVGDLPPYTLFCCFGA